MTRLTHRVALGVVVAGIAAVAAAGVYAAARDQNTNQPPAPFMGGRGGPGGRGMGPDGPMGLPPMLASQLQLTDAQRDQVKALADSHRDEWQGLASRARAAHQALEQAVMTDAVDEGLIRRKSADVAAVEADMAVARAYAYTEVVQILTPDQKAKLNDLKSRAAARQGRGRR